MVENAMVSRRPEFSAEKQALLEKRLRGAPQGSGRSPAIPRRGHRDEAPLSFAQQRLWFLDQLEPGSPLYTMPLALRLHGQLNRRALEKSLAAIIARHEVLRTRFVARDGEPTQVIIGQQAMEWPVVNLMERPAAEG